jgi:hypothetical protein
MSVFPKDWVEMFRTKEGTDEAKVRRAYATQPVQMHARRGTRKPRAIQMSRDLVADLLADRPPIMTLREVADVLRLRDTSSVTALILSGELMGKKVLSQWRIPRASVLQYLSGVSSGYVA